MIQLRGREILQQPAGRSGESEEGEIWEHDIDGLVPVDYADDHADRKSEIFKEAKLLVARMASIGLS